MLISIKKIPFPILRVYLKSRISQVNSLPPLIIIFTPLQEEDVGCFILCLSFTLKARFTKGFHTTTMQTTMLTNEISRCVGFSGGTKCRSLE